MRCGELERAYWAWKAQDWAEWVERWHATSTITPKARGVYRTTLAKAGRWLAVEHPGITSPAQWTRQTCAEWVAAVDRMSTGDYAQWGRQARPRRGVCRPVAACGPGLLAAVVTTG
jgi:ABC-type Fe2+-enterobactin transport system substrate-binding protein